MISGVRLKLEFILFETQSADYSSFLLCVTTLDDSTRPENEAAP